MLAFSMPSATAQKRLGPPAIPLLRLALLSSDGGIRTRRYRNVRGSSWLLALSGVLSVLLVDWTGAGDASDIAALRILAYAAWLYGLAALPALLSPEARASSVLGLARLRGYPSPAPFRVRATGIALRLLFGLLLAALPGLVTATLLSHDPTLLAVRVAQIFLAICYLAALALVLGAVGAFAEVVAPRAPRTVALTVVLVPFLLSFFWENFPSLVSLFLWGFRALISWGGTGT